MGDEFDDGGFGVGGFVAMFVLMRRISPYNSPDVLLGVFATLTDAEAAKAEYTRVRETDPSTDPWKDQAYKERTALSQDLSVKQLPGGFPNGVPVFVVSDYSQGFGQTYRLLDSLHASVENAERRARELDAADEPSDRFPFPHFAMIDPVVVGSLHSDLPEDQPGLHRSQRADEVPGTTVRVRRLFRAD